MSHPLDFRFWPVSQLADLDFDRKTALLTLLLLLPVLFLPFIRNVRLSYLFWSAAMVLEGLGIGFPWNWTNGHAISSPVGNLSEKRKGSRKRAVRSRSEQSSANGSARHEGDKHPETDQKHFPGLVNISGTYCFMNSTIQAMASLSYLQPHIDAIHKKAEALDVATPVVDVVRDLFSSLNTPTHNHTSIRPTALISALSNHSPKKHTVTLFSSREHQDAQELFQLLSECIKAEAAAVDRDGLRDRGLGALAPVDESWRSEIGKSPFDGLTANRRSCVECGYTEAVMHFAFDNWQLAVPPLSVATSCQLEECLADYTRLEVLTDCVCRKCSMLATHRRLLQDADKLSEALSPESSASTSKKKKAKDARRLEARVRTALDQGRIEDDLKGVKMEKVFSKASTKQAMVARPPQVLALHINRSIHYGQYVAKNPIRLIFPEFLDLTPYTTSGNLSTAPSAPISSPTPRSATPTPATYALTRTLYRLSSIVCHYGQHSFGHYVCFRRKPRPAGTGTGWFNPPRLGEDTKNKEEDVRPWLRVSDNSVKECTIADVLAEGVGAFMLYYEKVVQERRALSPRSSEETLRPEMKWGNGSTASLASVSDGNLSSSPGSSVGLSLSFTEGDGRTRKTRGPRVVRSVAPNRGRSMSVPPPNSDANGFARPALNGDAKQKGHSSPQGNGSHFPSLERDQTVDRDYTPPHSPTFFPPSSLRHRLSSQSLHARTRPPEA